MSTVSATIEPLRLDRRRVYIFPNRHGIALAVLLVAILLGSINYDNALGYLLAFLLAGVYLVGILHTFRNLYGLEFLGAEAPSVFAGDDAVFSIAIRNPHPTARYAIKFGRAGKRRKWSFKATPPADHQSVLPANSITRIMLGVETEHRGWVNLERVKISSVFPLGIFTAWAYFGSDARCLVYPTPHGDNAMPSRSEGHESELQDDYREAAGDYDFAGVKPYAPRDPVRAIAWKSLARDDSLLVKRFAGGGTPRYHFDWSDTERLPSIELRLSQLSKWIVDAQRAGAAFSLRLPRVDVAEDSGDRHCARCLSELALF